MFDAFPLQLGFWNLWICSVLIFLIPEVVNRLSGKGWRRACHIPPMSLSEKTIYFAWIGVNLALYICSLFIPLASASSFFIPGLLLFIASMVILGLGTYAYQTTPEDQLITKGIYKLSRNPGYFGTFCAYLGMALMGRAWLLLLLALAHFVMYQITVRYEERMCQELYPEAFPRYRKSVKKNFIFF
jgi:protein-S-isoprenylcysteine O-methyltransferase Ste14